MNWLIPVLQYSAIDSMAGDKPALRRGEIGKTWKKRINHVTESKWKNFLTCSSVSFSSPSFSFVCFGPKKKASNRNSNSSHGVNCSSMNLSASQLPWMIMIFPIITLVFPWMIICFPMISLWFSLWFPVLIIVFHRGPGHPWPGVGPASALARAEHPPQGAPPFFFVAHENWNFRPTNRCMIYG